MPKDLESKGEDLQSSKTFQDLILSKIDISKLLVMSEELSLKFLHPFGSSYFKLSKDDLKKIYGSLPAFGQQEITEARLLVNSDKNSKQTEVFVYLKFTDGNHVLMPMDLEARTELRAFFSKAGKFIPYNSRKWKSQKDNRNWAEGDMRDHYGSENYKHYDYLHNKIQNSLIKLIADTNLAGLNLIDGGCGTGILLKKLASSQLKLNLFGFDFNAKNVELASNLLNGKGRVEVGDLTKVSAVVSNFSQGNLVLDPNLKTVLTLSGSLTRLVLHDGFQALQSLHSIVKSGKIDFIIGGGVGEPLIDPYIAKQLGYKIIWLDPASQHKFPSTEETDSKFFAFERMSLEEILDQKIKKMTKRSVLNLALSAQTDLILEKLWEKVAAGSLNINENLEINLSFAEITDATLELLKKFTRKFPDLSLKMFHNDQACIDKMEADTELRSRFKPNALKLADSEIYLGSSRTSLKSLSQKEFVSLCAQRGIQLDSLIIEATLSGNTEILKLLVNQGLDINKTFRNAKTATHFAARDSDLSTLETLAKMREINWNQQDINGNTPIHIAASRGLDVLKLFGSVDGINWELTNSYGRTVADIITIKNSDNYFLLMEAVKCLNIPPILPIEPDDEDVVKFQNIKTRLKGLINKGVDLKEMAEISNDIDAEMIVNELLDDSSTKPT